MKFVILDRDGVINQDSPESIKTADEWEPLPGSLQAIADLNQAGYRVLIFSNQSGLSRGLLTLDDLHQIHGKMHRALAEAGGTVEAIFFCPHSANENCECRKPRPGLLHDIAERLGISLIGVPVVGDSLRDLKAAIAVGASPVLVETGKGRQTLNQLEGFGDVPVFENLLEFVKHLLQEAQDK